MNILKLSVFAGLAAMTILSAAPVEASWYSSNRGYWGSTGGSSSGWGSSGWGSSGWGSSGWGSSGYSSTSTSSTGGTSSGSTGSSSGGTSSGSTSVPEPSNFLMLGFGLAGLVIGRLVARKKRNKA